MATAARRPAAARPTGSKAKGKADARKAVKRTMTFSKMEQEAVEHVRRVNRLRTFTDAVRHCIVQQSYRDLLYGTQTTGAAAPARRAEAGRLTVGGPPDAGRYEDLTARRFERLRYGWNVQSAYDAEPAAKLDVWLGRFFPAEWEALNAVVAAWGFVHVVNACRFCVRVQAELDGFAVPGQTWR